MSCARDVVRRLSLLALVTLATVAMFLTMLLIFRSVQIARGEGACAPPAPARRDGSARTGSFEASVELTTPGAPDDARLSCPLSWDDAWFSADPKIYNHALATACSVLSALAYSESGYYQANSTSPAYMERALDRLGFDRVSTKSYRYRSEVLDQILNLLTRQDDTVAYTIARKDVTGQDGADRSVILVSIRGSYGAEWLSNLRLGRADAASGGASANPASGAVPGDARDGGAPAAALPSGARDVAAGNPEDQAAYARAAAEVGRELAPWIRRAHARGRAVSLVLVGHSRGGAVANLVAAAADGEMRAAGRGAGEAKAALQGSRDKVFAYTFASPNTTTEPDADAEAFGNIFNIVNPSDIMPYLPLRSWGYRRYGVTMMLPDADDRAFESHHASMRGRYRRLMGVDSPCDPGDARAVRTFVREAGGSVSSAQGLMTPAGVTAALAALAGNVDLPRVLYGHYPATYIAWMQAIDDSSLTRAR